LCGAQGLSETQNLRAKWSCKNFGRFEQATEFPVFPERAQLARKLKYICATPTTTSLNIINQHRELATGGEASERASVAGG
jgi:hypothetical protein